MITLENGKILEKHLGKYGAGILTISATEEKGGFGEPSMKEEEVAKLLRSKNIGWEGYLSTLKLYEGSFRITKKGSPLFDLTGRGDLLVSVEWGGPFNKARGFDDPEALLKTGAKHYKHASSNGGGTGYDYLILPKDFQLKMSEEDF